MGWNPNWGKGRSVPCSECNGTGMEDTIHICTKCKGVGSIRNKFNNTKTVYNGNKYDSKREAEKAMELDMLKNNGDVLEWTPHPKYLIIPRYLMKNGKVARPAYYIPDFWVKYADGTEVIIDIKGFITPEFKLKKKMWEYRYRETNLELIIEK